MKKTEYNVAVIGATSLVGGELLHVLAERGFPLGELRAFASLGSLGEVIRCGAQEARIAALDAQTSFAGSDLLFVLAGETISAEWSARAVADGAVVIDSSGLHSTAPDVPLVVPEVNGNELGRHPGCRLVACPDAVTTALAVALAPLHALSPVKRVVATTLEPASGAGRSGVAELERQTRELMSGQDTEVEVFPQRLAFNVFPQVGEFLAGGGSRAEDSACQGLRRLLHRSDLAISVTRLQVPVFYGIGIAANVELERSLGEEAIRQHLRQAPGLLVLDDVTERIYPTPADSVGNDATLLGRIRQAPDSPVVDLWIAIDNLRKGSALNAVQIAEILLRDHL
jgi:aspartate-semialdehyde dehydrogenase